MSNLAALLTPLALLFSNPAADIAQGGARELTPAEVRAMQSGTAVMQGWITIEAIERAAVNQQVRIERRFTIRVSPRTPSVQQSMMADLEAAQSSGSLVEKKFGKCVPVSGIAGVQPTGANRLMLFMRDQRIITADLEKACSARDFYSGFYIEQTKDGMLCVDRDELHSRTGANCEVARMRQLVPE